MKSKEDIKEDIKFKSIDDIKIGICYSDLSADAKLRALASKNSLVISVMVTILAVANLLFRIYNVYDIIPASFIFACLVLLTIIVLFINDYMFNKKLKEIIAFRYLDRALDNIIKEAITENKED